MQSGAEGEADGNPGPARDHVPGQLRAAAVIVGLEALALVIGALILLVRTALHSAHDVTAGLLEATMLLLAAAVLGYGARGLLRLQPGVRTSVVFIQVLALPVTYSLIVVAGLIAYGGLILVAALATLYLLFTPPARAALDHQHEF